MQSFHDHKLEYVIQLKFRDIWTINRKWKNPLYIFNVFIFSYLLHKIGEEGVCSVKVGAIFPCDINLKKPIWHECSSLGTSNSYSGFNISIPQFQYPYAVNPNTEKILIDIFCCINSNIFLNIFFLSIICFLLILEYVI